MMTFCDMLWRTSTMRACDWVWSCVGLVQGLATPCEIHPPAALSFPGSLLEMKALRSYPSYNWFRICILTSCPSQRSDPMIAWTFSLITVVCTESVVAMNVNSIQMRKPGNACFFNLHEQMLLVRLYGQCKTEGGEWDNSGKIAKTSLLC